MSKTLLRPFVSLCALLLATVCCTSVTAARQKTAQGGAQTPGARPVRAGKGGRAWSLSVSGEIPHTFSLRAKEASLSEIAGELSRRLKIPVFVSPLLEKQPVTFDFSGINLEGMARLLAPQAYIDYEVSGDEQSQPKALAIYLHGLNESPPSTTQVVRGASEVLLIEGNTEEGGRNEEAPKKGEEEETLRVNLEKNSLSVRARKQPLTVVLYRIAAELGVPFEMRHESSEVVDIEFNNYTVEQALRSLSTSVRLYYRTDLLTYDVQPLRIVLPAPASGKS